MSTAASSPRPSPRSSRQLAVQVVAHFVVFLGGYYTVSLATSFDESLWGAAVFAGCILAFVVAMALRSSFAAVCVVVGLWFLFDVFMFLYLPDSEYPDRPESLTLYFAFLLLLRSLIVASPLVAAITLRWLHRVARSEQTGSDKSKRA